MWAISVIIYQMPEMDHKWRGNRLQTHFFYCHAFLWANLSSTSSWHVYFNEKKKTIFTTFFVHIFLSLKFGIFSAIFVRYVVYVTKKNNVLCWFCDKNYFKLQKLLHFGRKIFNKVIKFNFRSKYELHNLRLLDFFFQIKEKEVHRLNRFHSA